MKDKITSNEFLGRDKKTELRHLEECIKMIQMNIQEYSKEWKRLNVETKEMYDNYRSDNPILHNDLSVGMDLQSQIEILLQNNEQALKKPYFGRVDYIEDKSQTLYIGKKGILKNASDIIIVDWRAPIATVYYDSEIGETSYQSPLGETMVISLDLKRTYEIEEGELIDYFDTDVIANDEFLTKYLGKNKEVVLGEIIATIQKEQNEIIRDTPWHSSIVQGVAGSGKTTVAMHRIAYLLYNFKEKFRPQEFYIIGSNKMLLNYITGVLPSLDVYNINQMTMEELLLESLENDCSINMKIKATDHMCWLKGQAEFALAFENYYRQLEKDILAGESVMYKGKAIYLKENILAFLKTFPEMPLEEKIQSLNDRVVNKVQLINAKDNKKKSYIRNECKQYKYYFEQKVNQSTLFQDKSVKKNQLNTFFSIEKVYKDFLLNYLKEADACRTTSDQKIRKKIFDDFNEGEIDLVDLAFLNLIKKRLKVTECYERISHMVVDEAQDFGCSIFYVLKKLFKDCTYTIMGDVSQNIYYDTGMNDWNELRNLVFDPKKDKFYILAKSYRNTVEISEFACQVLNKISLQETYKIEPIIRHGKEVELIQANSKNEMINVAFENIKKLQKSRYDTIAVICRSDEEAKRVRLQLKKHVAVDESNYDEMNFTTGVMVLPIYFTKGLEFDAVILWNPDMKAYPMNNANAKLLYVAITRALHELSIVYQGQLSELLEN